MTRRAVHTAWRLGCLAALLAGRARADEGMPEDSIPTEAEGEAPSGPGSTPDHADEEDGIEPGPRGPPPPPLAADQAPTPVTERPPPLVPLRKIGIGPDVGIMARPAKNGGSISYGPALVLGGHARIEALSWLGVRVLAHYERGAVIFDGGALSVDGSRLEAPDFDRIVFGLAIEPTWVIDPRFRAFLGAGANWGRTKADFPESDDLSTGTPTGVFVELPLSIGTSVDLIQDWLVLETTLQVSFVTGQAGPLFRQTQGFSRNGELLRIQPFPELGTSFGAVAGLAVLL